MNSRKEVRRQNQFYWHNIAYLKERTERKYLAGRLGELFAYQDRKAQDNNGDSIPV